MTIEKEGEPIRSLDDWHRLAPPKDPITQWKPGRSAMECAIAWLESAGGLPPEIAALLAGHPDFGRVIVDRMEPEALIAFDSHGGPRNADVAVEAHDDTGRIAMTVEAKADEPFDRPMAEVLGAALERRIANSDSKGVERAVNLARALLRPKQKGQMAVGSLRYQLLTGVAGTLAMARDFGASRGVFVVHEIVTSATSQAKLATNAADFVGFVRRLTGDASLEVRAGTLYGPIRVPGAPLFEHPADLYIGKATRPKSAPRP